MRRYRPSECLLCGTQLQQGPQPKKFCSGAHRVAFHRLRKRGGSVEEWRHANRPQLSAPECRAQLEELVDLMRDLDALKGVGQQLTKIAERAQELLDALEQAEALAPALEAEHLDHGLWRPLDDAIGYRETITKLAELDELVDDVGGLGAAIRQLHRDAEDLQEVLND